jgi:hypothetical protein
MFSKRWNIAELDERNKNLRGSEKLEGRSKKAARDGVTSFIATF